MNEDFDTASTHPQQAPMNPSSVSPSSPSSSSSASSTSSSSLSSSSYHHSQQQIQAAVQSLLQASAANTHSPSSSSTSSSSLSSSSSSSLNQQACNNQALAAAVAAAAAAGLNGANNNVNAKELAKLNMDVKNFKLQDRENQHQSSQMLLQQQFNLNNSNLAATTFAYNSPALVHLSYFTHHQDAITDLIGLL